jgi:hypothetical protein
MVDYLHERGHPFIVGVIPACWDAVNKKVLEMDSQPEFIAALRYAQKNGGRLVMQGYIHMHNTSGGRTGLEPEFWDATKDRPLVEDSAQYVRERIEQGIRQMLKAGLLPVGWITPQYAASQIDNAEVAKHFSTAVERVQLSDATAFENFSGSSCTVDSVGRFIIPENLSAVDNSFDSLVRIQSRAELQTQLRGTVSIASFPAYLTENKLEMLVRVLEQTKAPFLDLADGDHWVSSPDMILLTGGAQQHRTLSGAHVTWKAFDSSGKLLQEESESQPFTGERDFKRRGTGDYETYEIN